MITFVRVTGPEEDKDFPVEILPHLYLGNAANSEDREALARHRIQYILNVTPDLPNVFESAGSIKYMQIPISDHWSQNLASFFPQAIEFIGECQHVSMCVSFFCKVVYKFSKIDTFDASFDFILRFAEFVCHIFEANCIQQACCALRRYLFSLSLSRGTCYMKHSV